MASKIVDREKYGGISENPEGGRQYFMFWFKGWVGGVILPIFKNP